MYSPGGIGSSIQRRAVDEYVATAAPQVERNLVARRHRSGDIKRPASPSAMSATSNAARGFAIRRAFAFNDSNRFVIPEQFRQLHW